jgi:hypothetical protein
MKSFGKPCPPAEANTLWQTHRYTGSGSSPGVGKKLKVVHTTKIEDGMYAPEADYTKQPL